MSGSFGIRTDLAVESKEKYEKDNVEIKGVAIHEEYEESLDLNTTVVRIQTEQGARAMEKPRGTYITMEAPNLIVPDEDYHREISVALAHHLRELLHLEKEKSILVVGLGNREITPDALGPRVIPELKDHQTYCERVRKSRDGKGEGASDQQPGSGRYGADRDGDDGDHPGRDPGDRSGRSDRDRCAGGAQCAAIKLHDPGDGYGDQSGIRCLQPPVRAE